MHILVEDANDETPAFDHSLYRGSAEESMSNGSFIEVNFLSVSGLDRACVTTMTLI